MLLFTEHAIGRDVFLSAGIIQPISELWNDTEDIVRRNAHRALKMISETPLGADGIVSCKLVPKLVAKLPGELDEIKILILDELHFCMGIETTDALAAEGMETFTALLIHENPEIRSRAARNIMDIRYAETEKSNVLMAKQAVHTLGRL